MTLFLTKKSTVVSLALLAATATIQAKTIVLGTTYEISEKDAQVELMERVNNKDWDKVFSERRNNQAEWAALKTAYLPVSQEDKTRTHIPFYTSEMEVKDPSGKVIYPKGYTFNPLNHMSLPNKIWVLTPSTTKYFVGKIPKTDQILIANGNPLDQRAVLKMPTFILDDKTKQRLGITHAPSMIQQEGSALKITEYSIHTLMNEGEQ